MISPSNQTPSIGETLKNYSIGNHNTNIALGKQIIQELPDRFIAPENISNAGKETDKIDKENLLQKIGNIALKVLKNVGLAAASGLTLALGIAFLPIALPGFGIGLAVGLVLDNLTYKEPELIDGHGYDPGGGRLPYTLFTVGFGSALSLIPFLLSAAALGQIKENLQSQPK